MTHRCKGSSESLYKRFFSYLNYETYDYEKLNELSDKERQAIFESGNDSEYKVSIPLELDIADRNLVTGLNESVYFGIKSCIQ